MIKTKRSTRKIDLKWKAIAKKHGFETSKEMFYFLFIKYKQNSQKIAKELNVTVTTVYDHYKKHGIKITKKAQQAKKYHWDDIAKQHGFETPELFFASLKGKYTIHEVTLIIGCSITSIYKAIKKYGFTLGKNGFFLRSAKNQQLLKTQQKKYKICSCCKKKQIHKGFKYLCFSCWKNEDNNNNDDDVRVHVQSKKDYN